MRRLVSMASILIVAVMVAGMVLWRNSSEPAGGTPRQRPQHNSAERVLSHDLGAILPGTHVTHRFTLENDGNDVWHLRSSNSNCTCTVANVSKQQVAPGETLGVDVEFKAASEVADASGEVRVTFDDPAAPQFVLRVTALVRRFVTVFPDRVALQVTQGQTATETLRIDNFSSRDWSGIRLADHPDWLKIADVREAVVSDGLQRQSWLVRLEASAVALATQSEYENLRVHLVPQLSHREDGPAMELKASLDVSRTRFRDLLATPSSIVLGRMATGERSSAKCLLRARSSVFPGIKGFVVKPSIETRGLNASFHRLSDTLAELVVECTPQHGAEFVAESLTVEIEGFSPIVVPVHGRVVAASAVSR